MPNELSYILEQGQKVPENYTPLNCKISPVGTPSEVQTVLKKLRLQGTFNDQEVIFRKSGPDYEVFYKDL